MTDAHWRVGAAVVVGIVSLVLIAVWIFINRFLRLETPADVLGGLQ